MRNLTEFSKRCQQARDVLTETDAQYRDRTYSATTVYEKDGDMYVVWYKSLEDHKNGVMQRTKIDL